VASFADRLIAVRAKAGLSQYALAKRAGLTKQALSLLESGGNDPRWETVQRLALALGVSCDAFRDPELTLPPQGPLPRMGRPPKAKPAEQAPASRKPRGRRAKGKER
jgi:transcriptional regulator with XRE-family HTH domain